MMKFLEQKISGLHMRWKSHRYGIYYLRSTGFEFPGRLRVNGKKIPLDFADTRSNEFLYEFGEICLHDCYRLRELSRKLSSAATIVDIGANQGLFTLAARQVFPNARIDCYEPNPLLAERLIHNARLLAADVYHEAAAPKDCRMELQFGGSNLHTRAMAQPDGGVQGTALQKIIERAGGMVDILKMDCEGGEWALLEATESWEMVKSITMEYHLWAKPGSRVETLVDRLKALGFSILSSQTLDKNFGLMTALKK